MDQENTAAGTEVLDPVSDPESAADPVQVVSVDELVERLTSTGEEEETDEDSEPSLSDQYFSSALEDTTGAETVQLLREVKTELVAIKAELAPHDLMTTNFADYTVTEGLLLLALIYGVVSVCIRMIKGGFSWLSW